MTETRTHLRHTHGLKLKKKEKEKRKQNVDGGECLLKRGPPLFSAMKGEDGGLPARDIREKPNVQSSIHERLCQISLSDLRLLESVKHSMLGSQSVCGEGKYIGGVRF